MIEYVRQCELALLNSSNTMLTEDEFKESGKEARRLQIKKGKGERQRLHREWTAIKKEDDFAHIVSLRGKWKIRLHMSTFLIYYAIVSVVSRKISPRNA